DSDCQTLIDVLRLRADTIGDRVAYRFLPRDGADDLPMTFAELDRRARAVAARLQEDARPGDRALLLYQPGLEYIAAFFGCLFAGVIAVPAYPPHPRRPDPRVPSIIGDSGATIGLTTAALFSRLERWRGDDPSLGHLRWLATEHVDPPATAPAWRPPSCTRDSAAMLQYTSGSTSAPRGVILTHANLLHNLALLHRNFDPRPDDVGAFWLPPFHDMGLVGGILGPCYVGISSVLMPPATFLARPRCWLEAITKYRATTSGGPNFAYDLCVDRTSVEDRAGLDLSSWRTAFNGAEPVRAESLDRFARAFASAGFRRESFFPCYGLAEATLIVSGGPAGAGARELTVSRAALEHDRVAAPADPSDAMRLVASGVPAPELTVCIVDTALREPCADGRVGEIWVSGPTVAQGYWGRDAESADTFAARLAEDGAATGARRFLRTGDLGALMDGHLVVTGRLRDLIVLDGRNVYPNDVELAAERCHPDVRAGHVVAFAVERDGREQLVVALEVGRRHDGADDGVVIAAVRSAVGSTFGILPDEVVLVRPGALPLTSSGKVRRRATREAYLHGELESTRSRDDGAAGSAVVLRDATPRELAPRSGNGHGAAATSRAAMLEWIRSWAANELELRPESIDAGRSLRDLGVDSLMAVSFVVALETQLGVRIDTNQVWTATSIDELADKLTAGSRGVRQGGDAAIVPTNELPELELLPSRFAELASVGLRNPYFVAHEGTTASTARIGGRELLNFSNYNYLGLCGHPAVNAAAREAIERYGTSVSASRVVSGERPLHRELEREIAEFLGVDDAVAFVGGHATNVSTISHLFGAGDLICCDELVHNSAAQGAQFSGARVLQFPHNDWRALDRLLGVVRGSYRRALVVIEGVYSADGDIPDLAGFIEVKTRHRALLMVDEAHSLGVLGAHGRGIGEHFQVDPTTVDLWMGTLSKALASCGGYIACRRALAEYLRYTAPGFVFSVGMTPPSAAAALAALRVLRAEPERVERLRRNGQRFLELARAEGVDTGWSEGTPVIPAIVGDSMRAIELSQRLFDRGINVQPMIAPSVPNDRARLRFFLSAEHTDEQIETAVRALAAELREVRLGGERVRAALAPASR
ncbi:MAG TPA: aminotransferase class I/II-fold pyridoxal phosphate-dependent enzyme, partial [Gemmatimonadaceae bacterium]|nr:aminotransferase class I/II-fold pyridoxal phosphate-dependent enzyme [Gemmatimonadaceae bacterium]